MEKIRNLCIAVYCKAKFAKKHFCEDELGASDMIAVIVLVAIVVMLGVAFREKLVTLVQNIWKDVDPKGTDLGSEISLG